MLRKDHKDYLIHWVSGENDTAAFEALLGIIAKQEIIGSSQNNKGSYPCVCFTETPANYFNFDAVRYKPFGISLTKKYIFSQGGRPVIYQSSLEFNNLPEGIRWRHVRYEPCSSPPVDFTWEREWRIKTEHLLLPHEKALIIVPDEIWAELLIDEFNRREEHRYEYECVGYGEDLARPPDEIYYAICLKNDF